MSSPVIPTDGSEPATPTGRLLLRPELDLVINCAVGLHRLPDVSTVHSAIALLLPIAHPRFRSLLVRDRRGRDRWRPTEVDVSRHVVVASTAAAAAGEEEVNYGEEEAVNEYLAGLAVSSPLGRDKPLWEFHLLGAQRCVVLRLHHALGDGISLMSSFLGMCRRAAEPDRLPTVGPPGGGRKSDGGGGGGRAFWRKLWRPMMAAGLTLMYEGKLLGRSLWVRDREAGLSGGAGVELWPRKLATARFRLDDIKAVKNATPGMTINDVVFGVISSGFSRYLDNRSSNKGLQITGLAMVSLRKQPGIQQMSDLMRSNSRSKWGNMFGIILLPVYLQKRGADPMKYLRRVKAMLDRKKLSLEAQLSYRLMSCLGPKVSSLIIYRLICNTTFTFSNVIGPREEIMFVGNPVTYLRVNLCGLSHAITMHMVSYAGKADMQILVAKDIIPDPQFLAKCFEEALLELKEAAAVTTQIKEG